MNIVLFIDTVAFAGTERHVLDLGQSLAQAGAAVVIACPAASPLTPRCLAAGLATLDVPSSLRHAVRTVKILAAELRAGRVDIIHAHNGRTHLLAVAAVKLAGRGRVVATQHFLAPNRTGRRGPKAWLAGMLHRWAEKNTAAFIAISQAVKDQMLIRGDAPAEKITVVHNGTTEPEITSAERIVALRAELGVADGLMVFCAARLQKEKDIPTLIKAMAAVWGRRLQGTGYGGQGTGEKLVPARRDRSWKLEEDDGGAAAGLQVTGDRLQGEAAAAAAQNLESRTLHSEGNEGATNNDGDGTGFTTTTQRHEGPGKNPSRRARDKLLTQISQINDASGQVYPAGQNSSAALPQVLICDTRSGDPIAIGISASMPQRCSLVIERRAALFIAGEGDQRGECERLIDSLITDHGSRSVGEKLVPARRDRSEELEVRRGDDGGAAARLQVTGDRLQGTIGLRPDGAGDRRELKVERTGTQNLEPGTLNGDRTDNTDIIPARRDRLLVNTEITARTEGSNSSQADGGAVRLLGFRSDVSALMAACDIFVSPCPVEGFGLVLLEAMALGKPVIAAGAGGPLEIVADGETGLLFAPGNAESLAAAMKRLLADAPMRKRMGEAGRKRYEEMFTAQQMAEKMRETYSVLISNISIGQ